MQASPWLEEIGNKISSSNYFINQSHRSGQNVPPVPLSKFGIAASKICTRRGSAFRLRSRLAFLRAELRFKDSACIAKEQRLAGAVEKVRRLPGDVVARIHAPQVRDVAVLVVRIILVFEPFLQLSVAADFTAACSADQPQENKKSAKKSTN